MVVVMLLAALFTGLAFVVPWVGGFAFVSFVIAFVCAIVVLARRRPSGMTMGVWQLVKTTAILVLTIAGLAVALVIYIVIYLAINPPDEG